MAITNILSPQPSLANSCGPGLVVGVLSVCGMWKTFVLCPTYTAQINYGVIGEGAHEKRVHKETTQ